MDCSKYHPLNSTHYSTSTAKNNFGFSRQCILCEKKNKQRTEEFSKYSPKRPLRKKRLQQPTESDFTNLSQVDPKALIQYLVNCAKSGNTSETNRVNTYYQELYYNGWKWPNDLGGASQSPLITSAKRESSLLKIFGYRVGEVANLSTSARHGILDLVFKLYIPLEIADIPGLDRNYILGWGAPSSSPRLKRIVEVIDYARRLKNQNFTSDNLRAIAEWNEDLEYLKERYYIPNRFHTRWGYSEIYKNFSLPNQPNKY